MPDTQHSARIASLGTAARLLSSRRLWAGATLALAMLASGCATHESTTVSRESSLAAGEGVVVARLVNLDGLPIYRFLVRGEGHPQTYELKGVRFGQTSTLTFVGRLPKGRYRPVELQGGGQVGAAVQHVTIPLADRTGSFDVEPGRVTDLGTLAYDSHGEEVVKQREGLDRLLARRAASTKSFTLALDPTQVPSQPLLAARFPSYAAAASGRPALGWQPGSLPRQSEGRFRQLAVGAEASSPPAFIGADHTLAGGDLGLVIERRGKLPAVRHWAGTVHRIDAVLALRDGRWLAGGEEGFTARSDDAGSTWQRLAGPGPGEAVVHLGEASDGRLFMVTMADTGSTVYVSNPGPIVWRVLRQIDVGREAKSSTGGFMAQGAGTGGLPGRSHDRAAQSDDRLVVYTMPSTLTTLDLRSGVWETQKTPHEFPAGMKVTRDGYVVGVAGFSLLSSSVDYGKTWSRLDGHVHMSMPEFLDRRRGYMIAADATLTGISDFKLRRTEDGGKTWTATSTARSSGSWVAQAPLWIGPEGKTFYSLQGGIVMTSTDQTRTWD